MVIDAFNRMLDEVETRSRALETSEKLYRAIGESINYGVWVCDSDGRNIYCSDSLLKLVGLSQQQASDFGWASVLHPDDVEATMIAWKECARTGGTWYREHRMLGVDGRYHSILAQGVPIRDADGTVNRWAGINLDISRLKNTERALLAADRRKDEFLATLAHELRNPLAPIRNAVRILDSNAADERQRKWGREVIARQVERMSLLLDDLLDVSRITRGQLELKKDYVDLKSVVSVAVETARPLLDAKRHHLDVDIPVANIRLEADPLRLSQIIGNLLTNAAKYTDPHGRIELEARVDDGLVIAIRDNGIGLSDEAMPGLFKMFSQVNSAIDRAEGGLGIGLALVKGLVTLHGGHVEVRSEGLGRGSEFIVHLPKQLLAPPQAPSELRDEGARATAAPLRGKLLVVDDNRDAAESLGMVLRLAGYEVCIAYGGAEAIDAGARAHPLAAIIDIGMPGMSGHELARRMRLEAWGRHAVLIALTGWGQEQDKQAARAAGFDAHLTKPVDPETIEHTLANLLADARPGPRAVRQPTPPAGPESPATVLRQVSFARGGVQPVVGDDLQQLRRLDRLGQVSVEAGAQRHQAIFFAAMTGERQQRRTRGRMRVSGANGVRHHESVHARQSQVEQHDVGWKFVEPAQRMGAVMHDLGFVTIEAQQLAQ